MSDGRSKYKRICVLLKPLVGQRIPLNKLWRRIMIDIGATDECIIETMNLMMKLGLIREVENMIYLVERSEADI